MSLKSLNLILGTLGTNGTLGIGTNNSVLKSEFLEVLCKLLEPVIVTEGGGESTLSTGTVSENVAGQVHKQRFTPNRIQVIISTATN
jgi:hypothetical protein